MARTTRMFVERSGVPGGNWLVERPIPFAPTCWSAQKKSRPFELTAGRSVERCLRMLLLVAKRRVDRTKGQVPSALQIWERNKTEHWMRVPFSSSYCGPSR